MKKVLVTGAFGFLGSQVCKELSTQKIEVIKFPKNYNLTNSKYNDKFTNIDYVIHLAGHNGGIMFNQTYPFDIFAKNTLMAINAVQIALNNNVKKFVGVLTSCGYPYEYGDNIYENTYLHNQPHPTIIPHGYAKRNLLLTCQLANKQHNLLAICVVPNTIYGPNDSIEPHKTKVMMALIKKFIDAKRNNDKEVICWGTGSPVREFIYVEDAAKLIVKSLDLYDDFNSPLNLGTGQALTIKELVHQISDLVGYKGKIIWDHSKPNGQAQKILNLNKMNSFFPNYNFISLETGIKNTINWYNQI